MEQNKISRRNFLRVAGASATAAAMGGLVPAASAARIKDLWSMDLQILATSDTHGKFDPWDYAANKADASGSVAQQATAIKQCRTRNTLVVDAGDTIQANSAELFLNDDLHPMIAAMNAIGYDIWTTGNHEYNYGMDVLKKVMGQQKAKVLTGNVYAPDGTPLADGYTIIKKGTVKIGVIGMVTPNIIRWDAKNLEGWKVTNPVDESRKIIDKIKNDVDVIIGVMHMDVDNEYGVYGSGVTDLANACPEFDVIVAAHGHKSIPNKMINGVLVVENKNAGATVSDIHVYLERAQKYAQPDAEYPLGTDQLGRCTLSRLLYGARYSIGISLPVLLILSVIGLIVGTFSACAGEKADHFITILCDVFIAFPSLIIAIAVIGVLGNGLQNIAVSVVIATWAWFVRIVRSYSVQEMGKDYILAARISGCNTGKLVFRHLIPNILPQFLVYVSTGVASSIIMVSSFAFLGLGLPSGTPEWGAMLNDARTALYSHPELLIYPGLCIFVTAAGFNLFGEALRDILTPEEDSL